MEPLMFFPVLVTEEEMPSSFRISLEEIPFFSRKPIRYEGDKIQNDLVIYKVISKNTRSSKGQFRLNCWVLQKSLNPEILTIALANINADENRKKIRPNYVNSCIEYAEKNDNQFDKLVLLIKSGEKVNQIFRYESYGNIVTPLALALNSNLDNKYIELLAKAGGKVYEITNEQQNRINIIMQPHMAKMRALRDVFTQTQTDSYFKQFGVPKEIECLICSLALNLLEFNEKTLLELNWCRPVQKPFVEKVQDNCSIQ